MVLLEMYINGALKGCIDNPMYHIILYYRISIDVSFMDNILEYLY